MATERNLQSVVSGPTPETELSLKTTINSSTQTSLIQKKDTERVTAPLICSDVPHRRDHIQTYNLLWPQVHTMSPDTTQEKQTINQLQSLFRISSTIKL